MSTNAAAGDGRADADQVMALLRETGVYMEGHYRLTSGRHSPIFLLFSHATQFPGQAGRLGAWLAGLFPDIEVDAVGGPAMGGVILAYETARALGKRALYAEKAGAGVMELRRGQTVAPGERVLVVEDAVTTGGSVLAAMDAIRRAGGQVVGVAAVVDRSAGRVDFGCPFRSLVTMEIADYLEAECPQCQAGEPLTRPKG